MTCGSLPRYRLGHYGALNRLQTQTSKMAAKLRATVNPLLPAFLSCDLAAMSLLSPASGYLLSSACPNRPPSGPEKALEFDRDRWEEDL